MVVMTRQAGDPRDPEDRIIDQHSEQDVREKMLDKTIADTFPASDPPSLFPIPPTILLRKNRTLQREF